MKLLADIRYELQRMALGAPVDTAAVARLIERMDELPSPEEKDTAWLIEMLAARWGTGYFWKGVHEYGSWGVIEEAVRFARKEDAERLIESLHAEDVRRYGYKQGLKYEACEHQWPPSPLAPQFKEKP